MATTQVKLHNNATGESEAFDLPHAEKILKYQKDNKISEAKSLVLPTNSPYTLVDGSLKRATESPKQSDVKKPTD